MTLLPVCNPPGGTTTESGRLKTITPTEIILEASDEAGQVCVGLDRPAGFAASSIDGMRRSIPRSVPMLFAVGNEGDCMKRGTSSQHKVDFYRAANEQCARIVLADIALLRGKNH